jgi:hypothetical protein
VSGSGGSAGGAGGGTPATCNATACGGDIVGTWTLTNDCPLVQPPQNTLCPTQTFDASQYQIHESVTFSSDATYAITATVSGSLTITQPAECITDPQTCAEADAAIQTEIATAGSIVSGGGCATTSSGACRCVEQLSTPAPITASGTYTTSGPSVTTTATASSTGSTGSPSTSDYCVTGNLLYVRGSDGSWVVFAKQ